MVPMFTQQVVATPLQSVGGHGQSLCSEDRVRGADHRTTLLFH